MSRAKKTGGGGSSAAAAAPPPVAAAAAAAGSGGAEEDEAPEGEEKGVSSFISKIYRMVSDPTTQDIVRAPPLPPPRLLAALRARAAMSDVLLCACVYVVQVCWNERGDGFLVRNEFVFASQIMRSYFRHQNFSSFVRQLNFYGFHKSDKQTLEGHARGCVESNHVW
jgi:hypothetical protein